LITMPRLDQTAKRRARYKALDGAGVCSDFWPISPADLPQWIAQRFRAAGIAVEPEACSFLAQRTDGILVTAAQAIALLSLLAEGQTVSVEDVARAAGDSARFDSFTLVDAALEGQLPRIVEDLVEAGQSPDTPVAVVQWATLSKQRSVFGELKNINEIVTKAGVSSPAMIIVGDIVSLHKHISWFENSDRKNLEEKENRYF
jgi:DNA polymerase-3 subunit delta